MSKQQDELLAFPLVATIPGNVGLDGKQQVTMHINPGMTLRDYFAGQAMPEYLTGWDASKMPVKESLRIAAECAYDYADAMLLARGTSGVSMTLDKG